MKFINKTGNTVRLPDIELSVPYREDMAGQVIDLDVVKKSRSFRNMVMLGKFEVVETGESLFEKNLLRAQGILKKDKPVEAVEEIVDDSIGTKVKIRGHFYEAGGYAKVNRNMAFGLKGLGLNVSIEPYTNANNHLSEEELRQLRPMKKQMDRHCICIDSVIPTFPDGSGGKYNILYTTIEASTVPQQFVDVANSYNEVWVTSDFCKEVLEKYDINPSIYVFPDTIDSGLYTDTGDKYQFRPALKDFVFVSLFGWSYRKGYDAMLKAYLKEFTGDDNVSLLIISRFQHKKDDIIKREIKKYIELFGGGNPAHIARYSNVIPENTLPSVYRACDSFVLFSRGEGFGIPYCFKKDTSIHTSLGPRAIQDIRVGDEIISGANVNRIVSEVHSHFYKGDFVKIKTMLTDDILEVTSSHKFLAYSPKRNKNGHIRGERNKLENWEPDWVKAKDLDHNHMLVYPVRQFWPHKNCVIDVSKISNVECDDNYVWSKFSNKPYGNLTAAKVAENIGCSKRQVYHFRQDGKLSSQVTEKIEKYISKVKLYEDDRVLVPRFIELNCDISKLMGYYLSEGSITSGGNCVEFDFHAKEETYHKEVCDIVKKLNLNATISIKGNSCRITVSSKIFADICQYFCGENSNRKFIGKDIINSPKEVVKSFINGYINGDGGSYIYSNNITFSTNSEQVARQMQKFILDFGECCSLKKRKNSLEYRGVINGNTINWIEKSKVGKLSKITGRIYTNSKYVFIPVSNLETYYDECFVYNFDVPKDQSYVSNIVVTHNCEASMCGLPVIATNHSGQTMFLKKDNSTLVDIDEIETVEQGRMHVHYWDGQKFPSLRSKEFIEEASDSMRSVYDNYDEAKEKNKILQGTLQKDYNINSVTSQMKSRLKKIWSKMK